MVFSVLPALDVAGARLAVWTPDGPEPLAAFDGDPLRAAEAARTAGADMIHLVDMDHALRGSPLRTELIEAVTGSGSAVQASGGIADRPTVRAAFDAGADRVVLGSAALTEDAVVASVLGSASPGSVLVGIECRDGAVVARGRGDVELELVSTLGWLTAAGAQGFVVTAIARVGSMSGPDLATIRRVVRAGKPVLAAGGVASLDDLRALRDAGAVGAVVGRAWVDGELDLAEAIAWARTA
ncbi:MAG TPA: HisA/HisF-related TIM barrel protein [Actinomycetota bacterium]|nr:HisA/HisF-related TIM barrel protein [Actinomycetota bacterium]